MYVLRNKREARLWPTAKIIKKLLKDPQPVVPSADSHHIVFSTIEGDILMVFLIAPIKRGYRGVHIVREDGPYSEPKEESWLSSITTEDAFGELDRDINYDLNHVYEFTLSDWQDIRNLFRYAFWQTLIDERFHPYAWPWAIDYLLECILSVYYVHFRGLKLGVDCDRNGAYFYDFSDGRPIFYKVD